MLQSGHFVLEASSNGQRMPHRAPAHAETADKPAAGEGSPSDAAAIQGPASAPAVAKDSSANAQKEPDESKLDFDVLSKSKNGKCRAVGCPKANQAQKNGFCSPHHNRYLIGTGQCGSWECLCGEKVPTFSRVCGKCRKWKSRQWLS